MLVGYAPARLSGGRAALGSHYVEASLGLTIVGEDYPSKGKPGISLMYLNRSSADDLGAGSRLYVGRA